MFEYKKFRYTSYFDVQFFNALIKGSTLFLKQPNGQIPPSPLNWDDFDIYVVDDEQDNI